MTSRNRPSRPSESSLLASSCWDSGLFPRTCQLRRCPLLLTQNSYFSSIFAASKAFPQHPGAASGASMTFFGLSPLLLSLLASRYFTDPTTGLNVTHFMIFLAFASGITHQNHEMGNIQARGRVGE